MPGTQLEPPPTFPALQNKPVAVCRGAGALAALRAEGRLAAALAHHQLGAPGEPLPKLNLRWDRLPAELRPGVGGKRSSRAVRPSLVKRSKEVDVLGKLDQLGEKEDAGEEEKTSKEAEEDVEDEEDEKEDAGEEEEKPSKET